MANYSGIGNNPSYSIQQQQQPIQFPYNNPWLQQQQQLQPSNQYLKCRPVSSREEAMACQIDLDGSLWIFPNVGNGKIYTKQVNSDGTATFATYTFTKNENPYNSNEYVTKEEFNQTIQTLMAAIQPKNQGTESAQNNNQTM